MLGAVGVVVRVPEEQLDAVTGLSGSGPAYVFLVAEAMIEAGVLVGLPAPDRGRALVRQTLLGAATLLADGDRRARGAARRGDVAGRDDRGRAGASSKPTASAAAFLDAVEAATRRSEEIGRPGR